RAAWETLWAARPPLISAIEPPSLDTFTTLGRGLDRSSGSSAWITRHAPNRVTSSAAAAGDRSVVPAIAYWSGPVEALFTIASTRPQRSRIHAASWSMLTELSTSTWAA